MPKSRRKHKPLDISRVVLSETAPDDVPIIFSQDGFYAHCKLYRSPTSQYKLQNLFEALIDNIKCSTIPYDYKIFKNDGELRNLSLSHPSWQYQCIEFYSKYADIICDLCESGKSTSLRYPVKIASKSFYETSKFDLNKYKKISNISTLDTELTTRYVTTFFSYNYRKEFMYYESNEFFNLEKSYEYLLRLDISKCFQSIYTHTLLWAVKSKSYAKKYLQKPYYQFGNEFDSHIRKAKHNETNGIVVGPEISRIYAEIILQDIDDNLTKNLEERNIKHGVNFDIRRYVDDYFIFTKTLEDANIIAQNLKSELFKYNLHINESKSSLISRPFWTERSQAVHEVTKVWNNFFQQAIQKESFKKKVGKEEKTVTYSYPAKINHYSGWKKKLIKDLKNSAHSKKNYTDIANFSLGLILRKFLDASSTADLCFSKKENMQEPYFDLVCCLIEVSFFLYSMSPTVPASVNLSYLIVLSTRFMDEHANEYSDSIKQRIFDLFLQFYKDRESKIPSEYASAELEIINIALAVKDMGKDYSLPANHIEKIFRLENHQEPTYFDFVCSLYYVRNRKKLRKTKEKIVSSIVKKIRKENKTPQRELRINSETTFLILDLISCPYLNIRTRRFLLNFAKKKYGFQLTGFANIDEELKEIELKPWFIKWDKLDLLTLLQKRRLSIGYH